MSESKRQLHLNLTLHSTGFHDGAWRHPKAEIERSFDIKHFQRLAIKAEEAKLDSVFITDSLFVQRDAIKYGLINSLEPVTVLSALAVVTERIGLIGTLSTSFNEPFNVARKLSTLDHISEGRAGWNIVTTYADASARNFNLEEIPSHAARHERANEFVQVVTELWDSWEDDALVLDKAAGIFADAGKIHEINHKGKFFAVRGPLNVSRPPQGRPFLVQAGSSEDGRDLASQYAEAVYTAQQTKEEAISFYRDIQLRLPKFARLPGSLKILPGICPIVGRTEEEALEKEAELQALASPEYTILQLSSKLGVDLSIYPLDEPFPELPKAENNKTYQKSRADLIASMAQRENLTLRQLLLRLTAGRGHGTIAGTVQQIADHIEDWFVSGAADGFNIMPQLMNGGLEDFVDLVVPELQRRGLFRREYSGKTLREHYGLARPANMFSSNRLVSFIKPIR